MMDPRAGSVAPAPRGFLSVGFLPPRAGPPALPSSRAPGSWEEGALSGAWEAVGLASSPLFPRGIPGHWRRKLNWPRGNVSGEGERPGLRKWEQGGGRPVVRVQGAGPDLTGVQNGEEGRPDSGSWSGASQAPGAPVTSPRAGSLGCRGRRARLPWGCRSPAPEREQLRASGRETSLRRALITGERLPRAFRSAPGRAARALEGAAA